jgi:competence protein ComGC
MPALGYPVVPHFSVSRRRHVRLGTRFHTELPTRSRSAFTLVETVIVLAAATVLLSLTLPALRKASGASRGTQCLSNLRQLHAAALSYSVTSNEQMPPALLYVKSAGGVDTIAWDFIQPAAGDIRPGPVLDRLDRSGQICQCPSFEGASTFGKDPYTGYNYNTSFIGAEGFVPKLGPDGAWLDGWANARLGLPAGAVRRADACALFGEGGWSGGANKFMRAPMNTAEKNLAVVYSGAQAFRHDACTNVVYHDGHCRCVNHGHEGKLATPALLKSPMAWPANGFLSNDDTAYDPR